MISVQLKQLLKGSEFQSYRTSIDRYKVLSNDVLTLKFEEMQQHKEDGAVRSDNLYRDAYFRIRDEIFNANVRLVVYLIKNYENRFVHQTLGIMDLIQEGNLGLLRAIEKFDHTRGVRFSAYAAYWIRAKIIFTMDDKHQDRTDLHTVASLDMPAEGVEDESLTMLDLIASEELSPEEQAIHNQTIEDVRRQVKNALIYLTEQECAIIERRILVDYNDRDMLEVIGNDFGVSKERIRHIEIEAIKKLHSIMRGKKPDGD